MLFCNVGCVTASECSGVVHTWVSAVRFSSTEAGLTGRLRRPARSAPGLPVCRGPDSLLPSLSPTALAVPSEGITSGARAPDTSANLPQKFVLKSCDSRIRTQALPSSRRDKPGKRPSCFCFNPETPFPRSLHAAFHLWGLDFSRLGIQPLVCGALPGLCQPWLFPPQPFPWNSKPFASVWGISVTFQFQLSVTRCSLNRTRHLIPLLWSKASLASAHLACEAGGRQASPPWGGSAAVALCVRLWACPGTPIHKAGSASQGEVGSRAGSAPLSWWTQASPGPRVSLPANHGQRLVPRCGDLTPCGALQQWPSAVQWCS